MPALNSIFQQRNLVTFQAFVSSFIQEYYNGRAYYRISMKDNYGNLHKAYAWGSEYQGLYIKYPTQVMVRGIHKQHKGEARFQVLSLSQNETKQSYLNINNNVNSNIIRLLQFNNLIEQQKKDLIKLQQLLDSILQPHLKNFLQSIVNDELLMNAFVELPASARHHHSQRGGLLNHSIECAIFIFNATRSTLISSDERELATVAGLLHDIGKAKTLTIKNKHSTLGHHITHEKLTLSTLAGFLTVLERNWPNGAALMMYLLTWEKKKQSFPGNPTALLIKTADQFSTSMDIRKQAFKNKPESFYYAHFNTSSGKQYVNRLTAENNKQI